MLTRLLRKILPGKPEAAATHSHKQVLPQNEHGIMPDGISYAAEKVVSRLQQAGFEAYVVGGAVRDLLLGGEPKDFDVATNARPEEVRKVFRRSRIIGRRFQIVHVMVGPETIEVTTFRGGSRPARQNEHGRIMQDNSYGSMEQDAARRDFTCNALYYNPARGEITDFHHGVADIRAKRLVMIGDARARYQEDPVRMLRAARLSGKLGFQVAPDTAAPIAECLHLLPKEPLARLFDEVMKLLFSGAAIDCLKQMQALGMDGAASWRLPSIAPTAACAPTKAYRWALCWPQYCGRRCARPGSVPKIAGSEPCPHSAPPWPKPALIWKKVGACRTASPPRCAKSGSSSPNLSTGVAPAPSACSPSPVSAPPTISCCCAPAPAKWSRVLLTGGQPSKKPMKNSASR